MTIPHVLQIGAAHITIHDGWTITRFDDGREVCARHDDMAHQGQTQTAADLGYPSVKSMNLAHDPTHQWLATWLRLRYSPVLRALALHRPLGAEAWKEEAAVLAIQRFAVSQGVDLLALAEKGL